MLYKSVKVFHRKIGIGNFCFKCKRLRNKSKETDTKFRELLVKNRNFLKVIHILWKALCDKAL